MTTETRNVRRSCIGELPHLPADTPHDRHAAAQARQRRHKELGDMCLFAAASAIVIAVVVLSWPT